MITEQVQSQTRQFIEHHPDIQADQQIVERVFQRCELSWHRAGQTVCTDHQPGCSVFFLLSGTASLYEGEERLVDEVAPVLLGLMSQPERMLLCIATSRVCIGRLSVRDSAELSAAPGRLGMVYRRMLLRNGITPISAASRRAQ